MARTAHASAKTRPADIANALLCRGGEPRVARDSSRSAVGARAPGGSQQLVQTRESDTGGRAESAAREHKEALVDGPRGRGAGLRIEHAVRHCANDKSTDNRKSNGE